ncbi:hypothetical protein JB92DRAFT_1837392 [Gautieria morchelliformis]|nr:hypothetical protein JB92DRAFT_1837392 [Gautieria morchelliformis]
MLGLISYVAISLWPELFHITALSFAMSLLVDPTQLSHANGGWTICSKGSSMGLAPRLCAARKRQIHGYSMQFENPLQSLQASLSLTPIQEIYSVKPKNLSGSSTHSCSPPNSAKP